MATPAPLQSRSLRFLSKFRRVTSSGNFIAEIDGLRFIAIGTVVLYHLAVNLSIKAPGAYHKPFEDNWLTLLAWQGFHGVELFFVISGYILAYPFASHHLLGKPRVNLTQYFIRRVTRLEPPYMLCMILFFLLLVFARDRSALDLFPHLAASLGYLHNLIFVEESLINNVAWSLEIEIQFYMLVPALAYLFTIRNTAWRRLTIIGICIASILFGSLFITPGGRLYLSIARFLHFFLLGFLLADVYLMTWKEKPRTNWRWDLLSLIGWPILVIIWNAPRLWPSLAFLMDGTFVQGVLFACLVFFLYCAVFLGPLTNRVMTNPWITTIGGMCYTIYLLHNPAIGWIINYTKDFVPTASFTLNLLLQLIIVTPLMLIPMGLYFAAIEKPCMRKDWPQRLLAWMKKLFIVTRPA